MIEQAPRQFPGYTLHLRSGIEAHNGSVRFSWAAGGSEQAPLYLGGTDFAVMSGDGRFRPSPDSLMQRPRAKIDFQARRLDVLAPRDNAITSRLCRVRSSRE